MWWHKGRENKIKFDVVNNNLTRVFEIILKTSTEVLHSIEIRANKKSGGNIISGWFFLSYLWAWVFVGHRCGTVRGRSSLSRVHLGLRTFTVNSVQTLMQFLSCPNKLVAS
jgi:hypothetical protein